MDKAALSELISKRQVKNLYALASRAGLLTSGNRDDDFHCLVYRLTKKSSVKELTKREYFLIRDIVVNTIERSGNSNFITRPENKTNGMSEGQIKKAWAIMYEIIAFTPSSATAGERMVGAIKKILMIDSEAKNPFAWLDVEQGNRLIEGLKRYQTSVKKKVKNV